MADAFNAMGPKRATAELRRALAGPRWLTTDEHIALALAPRKAGTRVTVRSFDILADKGVPLSWRQRLHTPDHMYVEYDDGREQLIARGGPSAQGREAVRQIPGGQAQIVGGVTPARLNVDYGRGERVVSRRFVPGVTAQEAAAPAKRIGRELAAIPRRYGASSNSNSYAADSAEAATGVRPSGGWDLWGAGTRLKDVPPPRR